MHLLASNVLIFKSSLKANSLGFLKRFVAQSHQRRTFAFFQQVLHFCLSSSDQKGNFSIIREQVWHLGFSAL